jgi:GNAT superfamily N-acetyltransferase
MISEQRERMAPVNLPPGYFARPATMDDIPGVTVLLNDAEIADWGAPDYTEEELRMDWEDYDGDPGKAITLVVAPDGSFCGYIAFTDNGDGAFEADGYSHPGHVGKGIGTWLIQESERKAAEILSGMPSTQHSTIRSFTAGSNPRAVDLLAHEGYEAIRHFWRMRIDFNGAPPTPPVWPEGLRVADARERVDEFAVYQAAEEAFLDHFQFTPQRLGFEEWVRQRKRHGFDPSLWTVVWDGDQIAAVGLARMTTEGTGWVSVLGVRRPWRGRGLGRAILQHLFGRFYERGVESVALGVDASSPTGATRLYETAGMSVIRNFVLFEKVLREGTIKQG